VLPAGKYEKNIAVLSFFCIYQVAAPFLTEFCGY